MAFPQHNQLKKKKKKKKTGHRINALVLELCGESGIHEVVSHCLPHHGVFIVTRAGFQLATHAL